MTDTYWMVKDSYGYWFPNSASYTRKGSQENAVEMWAGLKPLKTWKRLYRIGYRCVQVDIVEVKP